MSDTRPIGIFDSGVGGLTVVSQIQNILPGEDIVYFGDTARVPYGTKSRETVTRFSVENVEFLMRHNVKVVVVACNTASSLSLDFLKRCFKVPIIGVIEPGAESAVSRTRNNRIGVIGTQATISSGAYENAIRKMGAKNRVFTQSCPLFVPLVEEGWFDHPATTLVAEEYLRPLMARKIDALVLGCTHYPLLKPLLGRVMGQGVTLIDSAAETARAVVETIAGQGLAAPAGAAVTHRFVVSDDAPRFQQVGARFIGDRLTGTEVVALG